MSTTDETMPRTRVEADLKVAMKAGDKLRLSTLRMILAEIKNEAIRGGEEVGEDRFTALVRKAIKQRQEAAAQFDKGGREDSAAKERAEAEILKGYLPEEVGEDELRQAIEAFVAEQGLSGPAAMGQVMKTMRERFGARADGATLSRIAKAILTS